MTDYTKMALEGHCPGFAVLSPEEEKAIMSATYEPGQFDKAQKLYEIVIKWRDKHNVWDGEVIALYDNVREDFDDLVQDLIRVVGYAEYREPTDD